MTERVEAEERQAFLLKLSDALRTLGDPLEIQDVALRILGEHLKVNRAAYTKVDVEHEEWVVDRSYADGVPPLIGSFRLSDIAQTIELATSDQIFVIEDATSDPRLSGAERAAYAGMDIVAAIGVPLVKDGRMVVALGVYHASPRTWTSAEIALVQETAERTWDAVGRAQAEQALRESEARYRSVFDSIDEGFALCEIITDADGKAADYRILAANPATERMVGITAETAVGKTVRELVPDIDDEWIATCARAGMDGESIRVEQYMSWFDRWIEIYLTPSGEPGDGRFAAVYKDVTDRHRAEAVLAEDARRAEYLVSLGDALRPLTDPADIQAEAARVLGEHLRVGRALYVDVDSDGDQCVIHRDFVDGVPSMAGRYRLSDFAAFVRSDVQGTPIVVNDIHADPRQTASERAACEAVGVRAYVGVGLVKDDRFAAFFGLHHPTERDWTPAEVTLVEETAERTWAAVERARAEEALRQSDARLRAITDAAPVLIWELDEHGATFVNGHYLDFFGVGEDEVMGLWWTQFLHPEDAEAYIALYQTAFVERRPYATEVRCRRADGEYRWLRTTGQPVGEHRFVGCSIDISDVREVQDRLRTSEERQAFLLELSDALSPLADAIEIQTQATRLLGEHLGANRVLYAEVEPDEDHVVIHRDYTRGVPSTTGRYRLGDFGAAAGRAYREGRHLAVADAYADSDLDEAERAAYEAVHIRAHLSLPLVKGGRLVAVLSAQQAETRDWTPEDLRIMQEVAERTWAAVERSRAEAAAREAQRRYQELFDTASDGIWLADQRGRFVEVNPSACRLLAYSRDEHLRLVVGDIIRTGENQRLRDLMHELAQGKRVTDVWEIRRADGSHVTLELSHAFTSDGLWQAIGRDITERTHRERFRALLDDVTEDLSRLETADEIMRTVGAKLALHLGVSHCFFAEVDEARDEAVVVHEWRATGFPSTLGRYRVSEFASERIVQALRRFEIIVVDDTETDPRVSASGYAGFGIRSIVSAPFRREDRWVALLGVEDRGVRHWHEDEIELIREVTSRLFPRLERARAEDALRESEKRLQTALAIETVGVIFFDRDGAVFDANDAFLRMSGYARRDLDGGLLTLETLTPPEWLAATDAARDELELIGRATPYEKEYLRKDGSRSPGLFTATMLSPDEGVEFVVDLRELHPRRRELDTSASNATGSSASSWRMQLTSSARR